MNARTSFIHRFADRWMQWLVLPLFLLWVASVAQAQQPLEDPPWRVAALSWRQGNVALAPAGDDDWVDLPLNRPLTRGDNVWSDRGALAEVQLGSATLHLGSETHLSIAELGDTQAQFTLLRGNLNTRVRDLAQGENFEIDTPNLAVRIALSGDYRVDVTPDGAVTRVTVHSGHALVYGQSGQSLSLYAGQQASFIGRDLAQVQDPFGGPDGFDQWAADRNRSQDESIAARYLPIGVVGYSQLDAYGSWGYDPGYGQVWYPRVTIANWAPYRYGQWAWIDPWGWTWVDEAPWGFAPFHYGRWAYLHHRWAWVPGRLPHRPVYSPALVAFLGGSSGGTHWNIGSGPGVAWYPLAPGERWHPWYGASPRYLGEVNRNVGRDHDRDRDRDRPHEFRGRTEAITAVPERDFRPGQALRGQWRSVSPALAARAPALTALPRPEPSRILRGEPPRLQAAPPAIAPRMPPVGQAFPGGVGRDRVREPWRGQREQMIPQPAPRDRGRAQDPRDRQGAIDSPQERMQAERLRQQQEEQLRVQQERARGEAAVRQMQQRPSDAVRLQQERAQAEQQRGLEQQRAQAEQQRQQQEQMRIQQERARGEAAVRQLQQRPGEAARIQQERAQAEQAQQMRQQQEQVRIQQERARGEAAVRQMQQRQGEAARIQQERAQAQQQRQAQQQAEQQQRVQERQQRQQERAERRGNREAGAEPPGQQGQDDGARGQGRGRGDR